MYTVEIDLVLRFVPLMPDYGQGVRLTRTIELPFPPVSDIMVFSEHWESKMDKPLGFCLKEITWDLDRSCFLAETIVSAAGVPIGLIPCEIRRYMDHGWSYGSFQVRYSPPSRRVRKPRKIPRLRISKWDDEEAERWETSGNGLRPKEFKIVLQAIVSMMASLHSNCDVAYAMIKTGGYVDLSLREHEKKHWSPFENRFAAAMDAFNSKSHDQQMTWIERIQRRTPRLIDVLEAIR